MCDTANVHASTMPCTATKLATPAATAAPDAPHARGPRSKPKCAILPTTTVASSSAVAPWSLAPSQSRVNKPFKSPTWNASCISGNAAKR